MERRTWYVQVGYTFEIEAGMEYEKSFNNTKNNDPNE